MSAQAIEGSTSFSSRISNRDPIAFLYRMKDRDQITDRLRTMFVLEASEYLDLFDINVSVALQEKTPPLAIKSIQEFFANEDTDRDTHPIYMMANLKIMRDELIELLKVQPSPHPSNNP